jgi:diacylglycerol kinase (ATP)
MDGGRERIIVWVNHAAGNGASGRIGDQLDDTATARGHVVERLPVDSVSTTLDAARAAIAEGADRLVVVGGDGTVHQGIQAAASTGVVFGVVPAGTGNDFATAMGVPSDDRAAIDRALGPASPIDLIRVGDRYGATVATLGLSVEVTVRAGRLRWPRGGAKYTLATLLELPRLRDYPLRLDVDGVRHEVAPNLVGLANTSMFGGGMLIAPDADPADGLLDIVLLGPSTRRTMLGLLPRAGTGAHIGHPDVQVLRGARVDVEADETLRVDVDGEEAGRTPIVIEVAPGALSLAGAG